ncbi:MAG TPA: hypothetical protein VFQ35_10265 [Polyangiaceae bacterium]|nr:hypothetical protein [Polyangiaceae bacterium]
MIPILACGGNVGDSSSKGGDPQAGGAVAVGGAVANGGGVAVGGAISGGGTTGILPGEKALEALSADELAQLRQAVDTQISTELGEIPLPLRCHYQSVLQASYIAGAGSSGTSDDVREACASGDAICVRQGEAPYIDSKPLRPTTFVSADTFSHCSATVRDYQTCTTDLVRAEADVMMSLPACDTLDVHAYPKGLGTVPVDMVEPSSCMALYAQCPGLNR